MIANKPNGRKFLTSLRFCGKRLFFHYLQYRKVISLSSKSGRIFTRTNYGNSYWQGYYRINHITIDFLREVKHIIFFNFLI